MMTLSENPEDVGFDTVPVSQLNFASANPIAGDDLAAPEPPIDRTTAEEYLRQLPDAMPADQWRMKRSLAAFRDNALKDRRALQDEHIEKLVTDDAYQNSIFNTPEFHAAEAYQAEPNGLKDEAITQHFLAYAYGKPVADLDGSVPEIRDAYAQQYFGKPKVTNAEFVGLVKGQFEARKKSRQAIEQLPGSLVEAIFKDQEAGIQSTPLEIVQQWKAANPDTFRPEYEAQVLASAQNFFAENEAWMRQHGPTARMIFDTLSQKTGAEPAKEGTPTQDQAIDALIAMPRPDRFKAYQMGGLYAAKTGDPKGFAQQLGESVSRSVTETFGAASLMAAEARAESLLQILAAPDKPDTGDKLDMRGMVGMGGGWFQFKGKAYKLFEMPKEQREQISEEIRATLPRIEVARELNQIATGEIDPIKPINDGLLGIIEQGAYGAAGSLPYLAAAAIPIAGAPLAMSAYTVQEYDRIRFKYPDVSMREAGAMSLVSGGLQGMLDRFQVDAITGNLPVAGKFFESLTSPGPFTLKRLAAQSGLNMAEQFGQETLQNLTPIVVDATAKALGADMPQYDFSKDFQQFKDGQLPTFFALLPYVLIGAGAMGLRDLKRTQELTADLKTLGFEPAQVAAVVNAATPEEADVEYRKIWKELPIEKKAAAIARYDARTAQAMEAQADPNRATFKREGSDFVVYDPAGKEVYRTADEDSGMAAYLIESQRASRESLARQAEQETDEGALATGKTAAENALFGEGIGGMSSPDDLGDQAAGTRPHVPDLGTARAAATDIANRIEKLGVTIIRETGKPGDKGTRVEWDSKGNISLRINEPKLDRLESLAQETGLPAGESSTTVLDGEEFTHVAQAFVMRKEWQQNGSQGDFKEFAKEYNQAIFDDIEQTVNAAPPALANDLREALRASYHVYKSPFAEGSPLTGEVMNLKTLFSDISDRNETLSFVAEFLRQAAQMKRTGKITEDVHATITSKLFNKLRAFIARSLQTLRQALPGAFKGEFGLKTKETLEKMEAEINAATPGKAPAASQDQTGGVATRELDPEVRQLILDDSLKALDKNPEKRLSVYQAARKRLDKIRKENRRVIEAPRVINAGPALDNIEAERAATIADLDIEEETEIANSGAKIVEQFAQRIEEAKTESFRRSLEREARARAVERRRAIEQKYAERRKAVEAQYSREGSYTEQIARNINSEKARVAKVQERKVKYLNALGELDAILSVLPPDIRGKIGGYTTLARIGTGEKALTDFFVDRVRMIDEEVERALVKEYDAKLRRIFERSKPAKDEAGKKRLGKAGADLHSLYDTLQTATTWTPDEAQAHIDALEAQIAKGEMTAEQEAHATLEQGLVNLVADWKNADAERRAVAVSELQRVWQSGYADFKIAKAEQRQRREEARARLIAATGKAGTDAERDQRTIDDNGLKGDWKRSVLDFLNFEQVVHWAFGKDSRDARNIVDMERKASNAKDDAIQAKQDALDDLFTGLAGGSRFKGEQLRWNLAQKTLKIGDRKLSPFEAITATLMWRQEDGRRHMLGQLDETGKVISSWHYDQKFIDKIESALSDDAKAVRDFLAAEYDAEYDDINPTYRELFGINMPRHENYSPIKVAPQQAPQAQSADPFGTTVATGSFTPGSLRTRGGSIAQPRFLDAVQVYISHTKEIQHWKNYAKMNAEARALIGNRDVANSVESAAGDQAVRVLGRWLEYFSLGGVRDAAAFSWYQKIFASMANNAASIALVGRLGTLAVQATQLSAALAEMPTAAYLPRLGKLFAGRLSWHQAFQSDYIQRRLNEMPPIVRQAVEGLKSDRPNYIRHTVAKLGRLIGGADALFTAGTYAIVHDYQLSRAKEMGMSDVEASEYAKEAAERSVDRVAQPTRPGARSIYENTATSPFQKLVWAFASETRKNIALSYYAAAKETSWTTKARVVGSALFINAALAAVIRNAWRDARDDEDEDVFDEKNWSGKRIALAVMTDWLPGIPVLGEKAQNVIYGLSGEYIPDGDLFSSLAKVPSVAKRNAAIVKGEKTFEVDAAMKDVESILTVMGLGNSTVASLASLSHLARDLFGVADNVEGTDKK